jgi:hypothetical protein
MNDKENRKMFGLWNVSGIYELKDINLQKVAALNYYRVLSGFKDDVKKGTLIECFRKVAVHFGYCTLQCIVIAHARLMS